MEELEWRVNEPARSWRRLNYSFLVLGAVAVFLVLWYFTIPTVALLGLALFALVGVISFWIGDRREVIRVALSDAGFHTLDRRGRTQFFPWSSVESFEERDTLLGGRIYEMIARTEGRIVYIPLMPVVGEQFAAYVVRRE
jgi:hypothetical protein